MKSPLLKRDPGDHGASFVFFVLIVAVSAFLITLATL